jgi:hypothetical protein
MKKTKRIIKKQTKKRINKKQTKKRNKKTFYMQRGGPKKPSSKRTLTEEMNADKQQYKKAALDEEEEDEEEEDEEEEEALAGEDESEREVGIIISSAKEDARYLIREIETFLRHCGIKIYSENNEDGSITIYLYLVNGTEPVYFYYTTYKYIQIDPEDMEEEFYTPVEHWPVSQKKIIINAPPEYKRSILQIKTQLSVLNGFGWAILVDTYLMSKALLEADIIFASKEDMTDRAGEGSLNNMNHLLGFWSTDDMELLFHEHLRLPKDMSFEDYLQSLKTEAAQEIAVYGEGSIEYYPAGAQVVGIPLTGAVDISTQPNDDDYSPSQYSQVESTQESDDSVSSSEEEAGKIPPVDPSKYAITPVSLSYLRGVLPNTLDEKKTKFLKMKAPTIISQIEHHKAELRGQSWEFVEPK